MLFRSHPDLPDVLWLRGTACVPGAPFAGKTWVIEAMGHGALRRSLPGLEAVLRGATAGHSPWSGRLALSPRLLGVYDFDPTPGAFESWWPQWAGLTQSGDVWMVHASTQEVPGDAIAQARLAEWKFLSRPEALTTLTQQEIGRAHV